MIRHSSLELTGRYTRPRVVDIEAATSMLPSLKPKEGTSETLAATGTDGKHINDQLSLHFPYKDDRSGVDKSGLDQMLARNRRAGCLTLASVLPGKNKRLDGSSPPEGTSGDERGAARISNRG